MVDEEKAERVGFWYNDDAKKELRMEAIKLEILPHYTYDDYKSGKVIGSL